MKFKPGQLIRIREDGGFFAHDTAWASLSPTAVVKAICSINKNTIGMYLRTETRVFPYYTSEVHIVLIGDQLYDIDEHWIVQL